MLKTIQRRRKRRQNAMDGLGEGQMTEKTGETQLEKTSNMAIICIWSP